MAKKLKEYKLHIIIDEESDTLEKYTEYIDTGYSFDIDGVVIPLSKKMGEYVDEVTNSDILGIG